MITLGEISKAEAARYMGIRTAPDSQTAAILDKYEVIVRDRLKPSYVYREADVEISAEGVQLSGFPALLTGKSIRKHLEGCNRAVVLAATVSAEADRLIRETSVVDMAAALAVDALCSAAIEQTCDIAEAEIFGDMPKEARTFRFSAGYGDLPIELQRDFLEYLNAQRRIGLTCTDSYLLTPTKSVTAIIGLQ